MKGILTLLFLCAILCLAHGNFYRALDEAVAQQYTEDWNRFRVAMMAQLQQDLKDGKKGPITILGEALLDTVLLLLDDTPKTRSAEGQRRSDLSDLDFRDSSVIPGSETDSETGSHYRTENNNISDDKCFVRQILDLISLFVTNAYDGDIRKYGQPPTGPKLLHLLVYEISENIESLKEIEILDTALYKTFKLIERILKELKLDLTSSYKDSPEIKAVVKLLTEIESILENCIEANSENTAEEISPPAIHRLLDRVQDVLEELAGVPASNSTGENLSKLRAFITELRSTVKVLISGKGEKESNSYPAGQVLYSVKRVLAQVIQDMKASENKPGSFDYLMYGFLTSIHSQLEKSLPVETPEKDTR